MTEQANSLGKDQNPTPRNSQPDATPPAASNQAFQVSITDQAKQVLQSEQTSMATGSTPQTSGQETPQNPGQPGQGPRKIIDLVA